jgi:hypothetical protein
MTKSTVSGCSCAKLLALCEILHKGVTGSHFTVARIALKLEQLTLRTKITLHSLYSAWSQLSVVVIRILLALLVAKLWLCVSG